MIPRFRPPISVAEVVAAFGPGRGSADIAAFEAAFASVMSQRHAIAFPYGRTGLLALIECLGLDGREIICPAYTCVVVPNAIVASRNRPVFVDSGHDANARIDLVEARIGSATGAVIATSIFGHPVDLDRLDALHRRVPHLPIIQDCAHCFICEWQGRPVHREGVAAVFGLNISKTMTSIFGGMVTTDNDVLAAALHQWRLQRLAPGTIIKSLQRFAYALAVMPAFWPPLFALTERLRRSGLLDRFTRYYDEDRIDMPDDYLIAMSPIEARVGCVQTGRLAGQIAARRAYDLYYRVALAGMPSLAFIERSERSSVSHVAARVANRDWVIAQAARRGVELGHVIEYSVPDLPAYRRLQTPGSNFPVARMLSQTTINLPTSLAFDRGIADRVVTVLSEILRNASPPPPLPRNS